MGVLEESGEWGSKRKDRGSRVGIKLKSTQLCQTTGSSLRSFPVDKSLLSLYEKRRV